MTLFPYEDSSLSASQRAADLVKRLSLRDKVALMFQTIASPVPLDAENNFVPSLGSMRSQIEKGLTHFNLHGSEDTAKVMAERYNELQRFALSVNAKIPITLSSDPRHAFSHNPLASMFAGCFSQWPESLGMVAIADEAVMQEYADIVRQEYVAVGLRAALHPQVDLATQYLWSRISGGMGEDADLASRLVTAFVRGLQGERLGPTSVSGCVKHFPGGGPQRDGYDCHMPWGQEQDYPGDQFEYHLKPFRAAVDAGVRAVMPSYGKPMNTKFEEVAMAFNKGMIQGVLRDDLHFKGVVLSDWCILQGFPEAGEDALVPKAWGVEHLSLEDRLIKALDAGVDQFGGETCVDTLLELVESGKVSEDRIDRSAQVLLNDKFALGLFDVPFVDVNKAATIVGSKSFVDAGLRAQAASLVLLLNKSIGSRPVLPLSQGIKVFTEGFESFPTYFAGLAASPSEADVIIVRMQAPFESMGQGALAQAFHHGSLEFKSEQLDHIAELATHAPVIIDLYCDRPAVLASLVDSASAIICNFGVREDVLCSVLFGDSAPKGKMPFDMPRTYAAVLAKKLDTPFDSVDPIFRCGHGLTY